MASGGNLTAENKISEKKQGSSGGSKGGRSLNTSVLKKRLKNALFIVAAAYLVFSIFSQQSALSKNKESIALLNDQISDKQIEIERLTQEYENIGTDEYIERMAREKLGFVLPNERVFKDANKK